MMNFGQVKNQELNLSAFRGRYALILEERGMFTNLLRAATAQPWVRQKILNVGGKLRLLALFQWTKRARAKESKEKQT